MKAVLLMAYGTPRTLGDVEAYYTHIRGGRKPTKEEVDGLIERYNAIGGTSPLMEITERARAALQEKIREGGSDTKVFSAMKHSPPFISEVVSSVSKEADELLAVALAPHYSGMSVGSYIKAVEDANAAAPRKMRLEFVRSWHTNPLFIKAWAGRVRRAEAGLPPGYALIFSAHSLPERILESGDPYKAQLLETSRLIAQELGKSEWTFSFQSAGHTSEPWMGPDILEHLEELYGRGKRAFLVAQVGFVSDHLEVLYDLDFEAKSWADKRGVTFRRCESLNDSEELVRCLYSLAADRGFA
ncbi:MAG: ferrochelatase [Nitrososphaerota archaeon]|nr:ferrochelatase [Nitrososphaerota archaeon]